MPGCRAKKAHDSVRFCVKKEHFKQVPREVSDCTGGNCKPITTNLKECEGKCTDDGSCANGLVCYNGEKGETIPGCENGTATRQLLCEKSHFKVLP